MLKEAEEKLANLKAQSDLAWNDYATEKEKAAFTLQPLNDAWYKIFQEKERQSALVEALKAEAAK